MSSPKINICNMALSHIAVGIGIQSFEERSAEAKACATFYDQARDETLSAAYWPFAQKTLALAKVQDNPTPEWGYAYRLPADCILVKRILTGGSRATNSVYQVPMSIGADDVGSLIYTDQPNATIQYTARLDDPSRYPPLFSQTLALQLALYIAPRITQGGGDALIQRVYQLYQLKLNEARATQFNQEQFDKDPDAEIIRGRSW